MPDSSITYFKSASKLLAAHTRLILPLLLVGFIGFTVNDMSGDKLFLFSLLSSLFMLIIMPVVYGRFNQIVSNKPFVSWNDLFNKYFFKYVGLILLMVLMMFILLFFFSLFAMSSYAGSLSFSIILALYILIFRLIALYAVPLIFFDNSIKQSLTLGLKCFLGNLPYNFPFILIILLLSLASAGIMFIGKDHGTLNIILNCSMWVVSFVVEFIIFIAITMILRDKIYSPTEA